MTQNVFIHFLKSLDVPFTKGYATKLYNEHPHKNNMYGLSLMLEKYNIENVGLQLENKDDISNLETPFLAYTQDFVLVHKVTPGEISYVWNGKRITNSREEFFSLWKGIVLVAETNDKSGEPEYTAQRRKEWFSEGRKVLFLVGVLWLMGLYYINSPLNIATTLLLLVNITGLFISHLLLLKQMNIQGQYVDKLCSLFKQSDCNNILESEEARFLDIVSWSEVGFSYFLGNILILVFFPSLINYMAILNLCALPYTVWSIWYQAFKAKQWCPLCMGVQAVLWIVFLFHFGLGLIVMPVISSGSIVTTGFLYLLPLLAVNLVATLISQEKKGTGITQELNSIKANDDIFFTLLTKQPYHEVDRTVSGILLGNPEGEILLTVLTNPYCGPCARMHKRINALIKENNSICVQYIFSAFSEDLEPTNHHLIGLYQKYGMGAEKMFDEWFEKGKTDKEAFFNKYEIDRNTAAIQEEYARHDKWKQDTALRSTPTLLVNGYKLPDIYQVEDLKYFTQFKSE